MFRQIPWYILVKIILIYNNILRSLDIQKPYKYYISKHSNNYLPTTIKSYKYLRKYVIRLKISKICYILADRVFLLGYQILLVYSL